MLKYYIYKNKGYQFEESEAPEGAVEVRNKSITEVVENKAVIPANKASKKAAKK